MANTDNIKFPKSNGMTVPEGYFDDFAARMAASLPEQEWERAGEAAAEAPRRTVWQIVRPYVYLAAMFMGVWLMMNMFDHIRPSASLSVESSPVLAEAVGNDAFINEYFLDNADSDELLDDIWSEE